MKPNLRLVKQFEGMCGPASVKMVMVEYGIVKPQLEWAKILGATKEKGCSGFKIRSEIFKKLGFHSEYRNNIEYDVVRDLIGVGVYPIVYRNVNGEGHYSVIDSINSINVLIADPKKRGHVLFTRKEFLTNWYDPDSPKDRREIIAILPKGYKSIDSLLSKHS